MRCFKSHDCFIYKYRSQFFKSVEVARVACSRCFGHACYHHDPRVKRTCQRTTGFQRVYRPAIAAYSPFGSSFRLGYQYHVSVFIRLKLLDGRMAEKRSNLAHSCLSNTSRESANVYRGDERTPFEHRSDVLGAPC